MNPLIDNRGTELEIGQKVCYNYQGEIAFGVIREFKKSTQYGHIKTVIVVEMLNPTKEKWDRVTRQSTPVYGHLSTVRSSRNLMVVFEEKV